jgi:glycosyltransferase involved in cell wall biosynthesis
MTISNELPRSKLWGADSTTENLIVEIHKFMKLAILTDAWHPQICGVVTTLTKTIEEIRKLGHQILCVHPGLFNRTVPCPTYPQIQLAVNPSGQLRRLLNRFNPSFIHIVTEGPIGLAGRFYCVKNRFNFTTSFTTRFDEYIQLRSGIPSRFIFRLMKWFHSASASVLVSSQALRQELRRHGLLRTALWPRGVDTDLFRIRDKSFIRDVRPIFLYVGRVAVEKNIHEFLGLDLPGTKVVVGNGPALEKLKRNFTKVRFVGAKTGIDLARYFAAADVFVFPSKTDTFGIVMLEALACGVPVAAYPVRGPLDIIEDGKVGFLDTDLKTAALKALKIDPMDCRRFSLQYSWESSTRQLIKQLVPI